jgi:hypothetical protein
MVENNDNIQQRDEDNKKRCRRYNKRRGVRSWEEERGMGKRNPKTRWKMQRGRD